MSDLGSSQEYTSFRCSVSQNKVIVDNDPAKVWTYYDAGPRQIRCPLVCLPPVSGTADVYFKQLLALSARGYRVLSVEYPVYWAIADFCEGFRKFLDHLHLDKVHLCGSSLGGFLAQKFVEYTKMCPRVQSLFLCNSFCDTTVFQYTDSCIIFWITPALILKKMIMGNFPKSSRDPDIIRSIDFMVEKLDSLSRRELASRLTLNCTSCYVEPQNVNSVPVTIMDVFDEYALSQRVREDLYKCYPNAKLAHLKRGGNFPYLSRSDEFNLHLRIHLRVHEGTPYSATDELMSCSTVGGSNETVMGKDCLFMEMGESIAA